MTKELLWMFVLVVVFVFAAAMLRGAGRRRAAGDVRAKKLLTEREQAMFHRLQQAFPNEVVLSQVAFSALLTAKDMPTRATFNRKVADFVVATKAFEVLAVIELDDSSHKGREGVDGKRDALLEKGGYRVLRFKNVPDADAVQRAVRPVAIAEPHAAVAAPATAKG
jgi:very-short-patch-repair endonuclease